MAWDFSTEPEFQEKLDWAKQFINEEIKPLEVAFPGEYIMYDRSNPLRAEVIKPLQDQVKHQGLWACHLPPELGGQGYGQLKLALLQELVGHSSWAPMVFGCQAPDSGNAEILAHYGTEGQKAEYLQDLLAGKIGSCYSMTEPQAGSDPNQFVCSAVREGDEWVINGEKWYSSSANTAAFIIVMVITNPDVPVYEGASMMLVPTNTPGLEFIRYTGNFSDRTDHDGHHPYLRYNNVRVPADNLLGNEGEGFKLAQVRLAGGRLHHGMRTVGMCQRALDMMCERAQSRKVGRGILAKNPVVKEQIADSWIQLQNFRIQVLHAAWVMDREGPLAYNTRLHVAGVKVATPQVMKDLVWRSMHLHGALGVSDEMPLGKMWDSVPLLAVADGPTEVHKSTIAKELLRNYESVEGLFPSEHIPPRREAALEKYADFIERYASEL